MLPCLRCLRGILTVTLTVKQRRAGVTGGALFSEPIKVSTGLGTMPLGDWSKLGILNNYSGGVSYRTTFVLSADDLKSPISIDLGKVAGTAEVFVNGTNCAVRVAPPWRLNLTHADRRASQNYTVFGATVTEPERFVELDSVDFTATDGMTDMTITRQDKKPLAEKLRALKFVFRNGPLGFNVYQEIQVVQEEK